ncbi:hypothetical protein [Bowmanella dokdonensis]|uniref:Uncharacterized protein n=1 Tax=Bowmanella dokdonensis TaxID=751969 RepID=A0A939IQM0_9ALTE|nr:hypothetical protein [Bowmanella dokdonensis]MBN7825194.1 hypothetical protein [Bowmanella dokdonensis]
MRSDNLVILAVTLTVLWLLINETTITWLAAFWIGDYSISEALTYATRFYDLDAYLFSAAVRAPPYLLLFWLVGKQLDGTWWQLEIIFLCGLLAILYVMLTGYWSYAEPGLLGLRISSTHAIELIWIPVYAAVVGLFVVLAVYAVFKLWTVFSKR